MCISGIIIYILSEPIVRIFSDDLEVIKYGSTYLKIAAFIAQSCQFFLFLMHYLPRLKKLI